MDVLASVRLLAGGDQWILLHLEVQSGWEADFEFRIFRYNSGLEWIYEQRVVTLIVLADLDPALRPSEDVFRVADFESRLQFPVCKLIDRLENEWRDHQSEPVQVARAQIEALRTASDPEGRHRAKWRLVRNLYDLGYTAEDVRQIFRLIDWMMNLREDLNRKFEQDLTALAEILNMPYVTSVERIAESRGRMEGGANVLLKLLAWARGPIPEAFEQRVRRFPIEDLEELGEALFDFRSLQDLQAWLDTHEEFTR